MKHSVQSRINILLISIALVLFAGFITNFCILRYRAERVMKILSQDNARYLDRMIAQSSETMELFVDDYANWDALMDLSEEDDPGWEDADITAMLVRFKLDIVWCYNPDKSLIYTASRGRIAPSLKLNLKKNNIFSHLSKNIRRHFYLPTDNGLMEIYGAPVIVPETPNRKQEIRGYFFAGRLMDAAILDSLEKMTGYSLHLVIGDTTYPRSTIDNGGYFQVTHSFSGIDSNTVATLLAIGKMDIIEHIKPVIIADIILISVITIALISSLGLIYFWVTHPLKQIMSSMAENSPDKLNSLLHSKSEFGKIANTIVQSFAQKDELIRENYMRKNVEKELTKERANLHIRVKFQTKRLEELLEQLQKKNKQLIETAAHKNQFLGMMSHELRTPLNAIIGFNDLLRKQHYGALNEKQLRYTKRIEKSASHLLDLISDLMDLTRIEMDNLKIELSDIDLMTCIKTAVESAQPLLDKKNLTLDMHAEFDQCFVRGNIVRCRQTVSNLLLNAIKYSPDKDTIRIDVSRENDNEILVSIKDNGSGIKNEFHDHVFDGFSQSDDVKAAHLGGVGIGLALTKKFVELMGGRIGFESEPGRGTRFWFTLITTDSSTAQNKSGFEKDAKPNGDSTSQRHILVADDNPVNRELIVDMLSLQHLAVDIVTNGEEAIESATAHHPDLIFLDLNMPGKDGLQTVAELRSREAFKDVPIIALSADNDDATRARAMEAGFSDYLTKPLAVTDILLVIDRFLPAH